MPTDEDDRKPSILKKKSSDSPSLISRDWQVGETITVLKTYRFQRIEFVKAGLEGGFGKVFPVLYSTSNILMAAKRARDVGTSSTVREKDILDAIKRDAYILLTLPMHDNVIKVFAVDRIKGKYHIFMEWARDGDLFDLILKYSPKVKKIGWMDLYGLVFQIINGMTFLHSHGIVHKDLKPQNILVKKIGYEENNDGLGNYLLKITDFGVSSKRNGNADIDISYNYDTTNNKDEDDITQKNKNQNLNYKDNGGNIEKVDNILSGGRGFTPAYAAPEQHLKNFFYYNRIDKRTDIFSFGIILLELLTMKNGFKELIKYDNILSNNNPPRDKKDIEEADLILQEKIDWFLDKFRSDLQPKFRNLVKRCMKVDPNDRYQSFDQVMDDFVKILEMKKENSEEYHYRLQKQVFHRHDTSELSSFSLIFRGLSLELLGFKDESIKAFEKAITLPCLSVDEFFFKGFALGNLGRSQEAIEWYDKALDIDPQNVQVISNKGAALESLRRYQEAIAEHDKALAIDPHIAVTLYNKGVALERLGRYQEAIECYDKALKIDPQYVNALYNKGAALTSLGRHEEAINFYDKALAIDPHLAFALTNKGATFLQFGRYQEAIEYFDKVLAIDPHLVFVIFALTNKGAALTSLGRYQEAIECYDKALKIDPQDVNALYNKGISLDRLGRYEEEIECFENLNKILPKDSELLSSTTQYLERLYSNPQQSSNSKMEDESHPLFKEYISLSNQEKYDKAIEKLDKLLEIKPNSTVYLYHKAMVLSRLGNYQEAITLYNKVLDIDKYHNQSLLGIANGFYYAKDNSKALEYFGRATIPKTDTESLLNKACALYKEKKYKEAVEVFRKVDHTILDGPDISKYNYYILYYAASLYQINKFDESATWFEKIKEILDEELLLNKANALCKASELDKNKEEIENKEKNIERLKEAVECFYKLTIDLDEESRINKANALFELERFDKAIEEYDLVIAQNKNNHFVYYKKGLALFKLKQFKEAIACFEESIKLNPLFREAFVQKSSALARDRDYYKALQASIDLFPDQDDVDDDNYILSQIKLELENALSLYSNSKQKERGEQDVTNYFKTAKSLISQRIHDNDINYDNKYNNDNEENKLLNEIFQWIDMLGRDSSKEIKKTSDMKDNDKTDKNILQENKTSENKKWWKRKLF